MNIITRSILPGLLALLSAVRADAKDIIISNPQSTPRTVPEMVEVPADAFSGITGSNQDALFLCVVTPQGDTLTTQQTHDGKLIFPCPPLKGKETVRLKVCTTRQAAASQVFGRNFPERENDFSFENDRVAYRLYGPGTKGIYGYDMFCKKTPMLVLQRWYAMQCDEQMWATYRKMTRAGHKKLAEEMYNSVFSYHVDHGEGMDQYSVGSTMGAGAVAYMTPCDDKNCAVKAPKGSKNSATQAANGDEKSAGNAATSVAQGGEKSASKAPRLHYTGPFTSAEVVDSGPLRLTVRLTYGSDTRLLTIDAHSNMVKSTVIPNETTAGLTPVAGIAIHQDGKEYSIDGASTAYEDAGGMLIGCYMPGGKACYAPLAKVTSGATGHVMLAPMAKKRYAKKSAGKGEKAVPGEMTYYFGSAWTQYDGDKITSMQQWKDYIFAFAKQKENPLKVIIK
ncbi:MAG: DUF4861 family protein [Prevotella sp.]|nr:DUF4861 family protein [Prevotella sp.]